MTRVQRAGVAAFAVAGFLGMYAATFEFWVTAVEHRTLAHRLHIFPS